MLNQTGAARLVLAALMIATTVPAAAAAQGRLAGPGFASTASGQFQGQAVDRAKLAAQVAALVNAGRCEDARRVALGNDDHQIASRVEAICLTKPR